MNAHSTVPTILCGVFVGGKASRMGGVPKGLLLTDSGHSIVERTARCFTSACPKGQLVLVGEHAAYAHLGLPALADAPAGIGPLGGLRALLLEARRLGCPALALAGDMPLLTSELLTRLCEEQPGAAIVAPRREGRWEPLFARYDAQRVLPFVEAQLATERHGLYVLLESHAQMLTLSADEATQLADWDTPQDVSARTRAD